MSDSTTVAAARGTGAAVYSVRQAAELLGLSLGAAYALVRSGEIPAKKLGGRWVVPKQGFHEWLNRADDSGTAGVLSAGGWSR